MDIKNKDHGPQLKKNNIFVAGGELVFFKFSAVYRKIIYQNRGENLVCKNKSREKTSDRLQGKCRKNVRPSRMMIRVVELFFVMSWVL